MQENPYSSILRTMREDANEQKSSAWVLGNVMGVAPLVIQYNGMALTGTDLLVNFQLRTNAEAVILSNLTGKLNGTVDCTSGSITGMAVTSGNLQAAGVFGGVLAPGDQVVMLRSDDGQQFVVLCKVVSA